MVYIVLGTTVKEKDIGVTISADMKVSEQCGIATSNCNQITVLSDYEKYSIQGRTANCSSV